MVILAALIGLLPSAAFAQRHQPPSPPSAKARIAPSDFREVRPAGREQTADQQVIQVLNRLSFGPRPGDVLKVRTMGVDAYIDQQLHPERIDDSAMDQMLARYPLLQQDQTELAAQYAEQVRQFQLAKRDTASRDSAQALNPSGLEAIRRSHAQLVGELQSERVARAVGSDRQLLEVMTDFWENHFNVFAGKNQVEPYLLADYDRTIREHALGKFRDLLGAVAHSPAMLVYLDNAQSRANSGQPTLAIQRGGGMELARGPNGGVDVEAIIRLRNLNAQQAQQLRERVVAAKKAGLNENYGRELMELHTLGVDGGYTQQDVIEAARALTGWSVKLPAQGGGFIFRPEWHDAGEKVFLGSTLAAGRGEQDGEDVLDILARSPATAHFLALQVARRFVSDSPSTALVDAAAQTYLRTDGDMREVVRKIVTSPEFFSARAYHAKVKSPFEVVVSAARALGAAPDPSPRTALAVAYLGQPIFGHRDPNGWPETGESWMNTGAILNRINFGQAVAANRLPGADLRTWLGADSLGRESRAIQVDAVISSLLDGAVSPDTRKILMSGEHPLAERAARQASAETKMSTANDDASNGGATMNGATMNGATMNGATMNGATMNGATMNGATMNGATMADASVAGGAAKQRSAPGAVRKPGPNPMIGPPTQLTGLAQVVALAIGSPEFQRR
jgi:uncharacterized protein (DUF1800 family)